MRYYRQISNISWIKSQNLNVSRLVVQLFLHSQMEPGVQMLLEQRRQVHVWNITSPIFLI